MTGRVYAAGFPCCLIVAPPGAYEEPRTLSYAINSMCPVGPDGVHSDGAPQRLPIEIQRKRYVKTV